MATVAATVSAYAHEAPADGLHRLEPRDRRAALAHLRLRTAHNAYLLAQIGRGALVRDDVAGPIIGHWVAGELDGVCIFGSNLVISATATERAVDAFDEFARTSRFRVWVAVGEDRHVDLFMRIYGRRERRIRIERGRQLLYCLGADDLDAGARAGARLRSADVEELEVLMGVDRAMVEEELGFDPFIRDLEAYRSGWLRRLRELRSWVIGARGASIEFKVDQSAVSEDVVQLAGIYTLPEFRRRGLARAGVGELCARILRSVPLVTLYVHRFNEPAISLYEALGFRRIGEVRSVWFDQ